MEKNTDYQLSTSLSDGIVEVTITGEITKNTLDRLRAEVITIIMEQKPRAFLWDNRAVKAPHNINIADAYFRVRSAPIDVIRLPFAIVDLSEDTNFQSFYETTAKNAGLSIRFFADIEAARAWLKSQL